MFSWTTKKYFPYLYSVADTPMALVTHSHDSQQIQYHPGSSIPVTEQLICMVVWIHSRYLASCCPVTSLVHRKPHLWQCWYFGAFIRCSSILFRPFRPEVWVRVHVWVRVPVSVYQLAINCVHISIYVPSSEPDAPRKSPHYTSEAEYPPFLKASLCVSLGRLCLSFTSLRSELPNYSSYLIYHRCQGSSSIARSWALQ